MRQSAPSSRIRPPPPLAQRVSSDRRRHWGRHPTAGGRPVLLRPPRPRETRSRPRWPLPSAETANTHRLLPRRAGDNHHVSSPVVQLTHRDAHSPSTGRQRRAGPGRHAPGTGRHEAVGAMGRVHGARYVHRRRSARRPLCLFVVAAYVSAGDAAQCRRGAGSVGTGHTSSGTRVRIAASRQYRQTSDQRTHNSAMKKLEISAVRVCSITSSGYFAIQSVKWAVQFRPIMFQHITDWIT